MTPKQTKEQEIADLKDAIRVLELCEKPHREAIAESGALILNHRQRIAVLTHGIDVGDTIVWGKHNFRGLVTDIIPADRYDGSTDYVVTRIRKDGSHGETGVNVFSFWSPRKLEPKEATK